jgi:hypothetical protein
MGILSSSTGLQGTRSAALAPGRTLVSLEPAAGKTIGPSEFNDYCPAKPRGGSPCPSLGLIPDTAICHLTHLVRRPFDL